jgi:hypothetical protein
MHPVVAGVVSGGGETNEPPDTLTFVPPSQATARRKIAPAPLRQNEIDRFSNLDTGLSGRS